MTRTDVAEPDGVLPPELAGRLYDLAAAATVQSQPAPGLQEAIKRRRRRHGWAVTASATAVALVVASVVAGLAGLPDRQAAVPPAFSPVATLGPTRPRVSMPRFEPLPARFDLPTAGALARDTAWISGIAEQVASQQQLSGPPRNRQRVLWAGDVGDHRAALVAFTMGTGPWVIAMESGPRGATAKQMQLTGALGLKDLDDSGRSDALTTQVDLVQGTSAASGGTVFVPAPTASQVDVATHVQWGPGRHVRTQWRPLTRAGAIWTGLLSGAEMTYGGMRVTYPDGTVKGYSLPVEAAVHENAWVAGALAPVVHGVARADRARLVTALTSVAHYGLLPGMGVEQGRVARLADGTTLAAIAVRTPQGGHLIGACLTGPKPSPWTQCSQALASTPEAQTPLLAVLDAGSSDQGQEGVIVIAPVTATRLTLAETSVPLTKGMTRLTVPIGRLQATATATDAAGRVLATAKLALNIGSGATLWNDLARHGQAG